MASWLVRSTPDRAILVRVLAGDIVLTLYSDIASLHPVVQMSTCEFNAGGNPAMDYHPIQGGGGGIEILLAASRYRNRDKLQPDGPLGHLARMQT